jgi:hypothetical protein
VGEARSASRALSAPVLNDRSTAKSRETTANDRLLYFMAQPLLGRKTRRVWSDCRSSSLKYGLYSSATASNSFFACVPSYQPKSPFVRTEVGLEQYPRCDPRQDRLSQVRSSNDNGHCDATSACPLSAPNGLSHLMLRPLLCAACRPRPGRLRRWSRPDAMI